ncbi:MULTISPECIES: O-antigen ligase [unclassified Caballeronia]|uniref:O-antigen ligase family protein n=1 Tax=unclassified Caballeronia TaxID=2646786 RepID=UPI001FD39E39|nr:MULTISPECIES: O-antigen ligase family protein [unclassified Caballeronia]MDR5771085.1 O-antigen ligase family protein [Caballeronia sp. LZ002]MDR5846522.1 O-antigen ligase family protein [Caballeronia sp. LZ003]
MEKTLRYMIASMVLLAPASTLVVRGGTGYCFFVLLAIALFAGFSKPFRLRLGLLVNAFPLYTVAMLCFMVYLPLQQAIEGYYLPREFDGMSRFALALPIFLLLVNVPIRQLKALGWGCALGAIGAGFWAVDSAIHMTVTELDRLGNDFTNPIPYGNTALLLGFLSVMSIRWDRYPNALAKRLGIALKLLGLVGGIYASYLSGTRGGWLAIPLFLVLCLLNFGWIKHPRHWLTALGVAVLAMALLLASPIGRERVQATRSDIARLSHGAAADSSLGARLQLWTASIHLFEANPVFGVGKGHLKNSLKGMADAGEVSPLVVNQRAHSEFFSTIAELGASGVVCLALLYFGPLVYFLRYRKSPHPDVSTAAYCGIAVSGSVIIFGLSIDVFTVVMSTSLIALFWAVLLAVITHDAREPLGKPGRGPIG